MKKFKYPAIGAFCLLILALGIGLNIYYQPHRDVKSAPVFDEFNVDDFTSEFLADPEKANEKYLAENGESKIVSMTGTISEIDTNFNGDIVITLKSTKYDVGARFTLMEDQKEKAAQLKVGDKTKITGVVSAGAEFDEDFNSYLDAILEEAYF